MIEIIGAISLLISVIFLAKKKIIGWVFSIIGVILYSIVFLETKLYADFLIQFIFLFQSFYGIHIWNKHKKDNNKLLKETKVSLLTNKKRLLYSFYMLIVFIGTALLLDNYTDANFPYVDSFVSTISIFANWLLTIRKLDSWIIWIFADIIFIWLFISTGLYVSAGLYFIFLINAIYGFFSWKKDYFS